MEQTNWIKTSSDKNPKDGQSIYLISKGIAKHATVKTFPIIRLDNGTLESIRHFEYWADVSIIPMPDMDKNTPVDDTQIKSKSNPDTKDTDK